MSSSQSTAVHVSKAAMVVLRSSVPAGGIWGVHDCWEIAPNCNFFKYSFRFSLVHSQYLSNGLMEYCPSDSHFTAAVRSKPKWCPKETCCIPPPLRQTHCHLLACTCRMKLFYGEVIFFQVQNWCKHKYKLNWEFWGPVLYFVVVFIPLLWVSHCGSESVTVIPLCVQV